jgi:hypothetical protein
VFFAGTKLAGVFVLLLQDKTFIQVRDESCVWPLFLTKKIIKPRALKQNSAVGCRVPVGNNSKSFLTEYLNNTVLLNNLFLKLSGNFYPRAKL